MNNLNVKSKDREKFLIESIDKSKNPMKRAKRFGEWAVPCSNQYSEEGTFVRGCHPTAGSKCKQVIWDDFAMPEEVELLRMMADRALNVETGIPAPLYGPAILDVNSGMALHGDGMFNIYSNQTSLFSIEEYSFYKDMIERIQKKVMDEFGLITLFFTAPTFITRTRGHPLSWKFKSMHDEYWHLHVDKNNTPHYDYSGLLYLSDHGKDFEGGLLNFYDELLTTKTLTVKPHPGRLVIFNSGKENPHQVMKVTSGTRYVLSFWFTCDANREFKTFLDGKAHYAYKPKEKAQSPENSEL